MRPETPYFSVSSYNILANAYIRPAWYPQTPAEVLDPQWRLSALARRIVELNADVICLQEVEPGSFSMLEASLGPLGYQGHYAPKRGRTPVGCAAFFRAAVFELLSTRIIVYSDGGGAAADSGQLALVTLLRFGEETLGIANTHLKWDPPGTPREEQRGYREIRQLLEEREGIAPGCAHWILCGDFNATPESEVALALEKAGLEDSYRGVERAYTCNSNRRAKRIDYLFHTPALGSEPESLPPIDDDTPLPSEKEPSDHLPIMARFYIRPG